MVQGVGGAMADWSKYQEGLNDGITGADTGGPRIAPRETKPDMCTYLLGGRKVADVTVERDHDTGRQVSF